MTWINIFIPNLRSADFCNAEPAARSTWLSILAFCCEQENGGVIEGAESWTDRAWLQTCGVTGEEVRKSAPLVSFENGNVTVWNYPEEKEKEVQLKRKAGKRGGLAKAANRSAASCATSSASGVLEPVLVAEPLAVLLRKGREEEPEGNEKENKNGNELALPIDENETPDLETFCEYFAPNMKCLGYPVPLDDWLMETYSYYATTVWPKTPCRNWKKMFGKLIANYRSRHAQMSAKITPIGKNGKPQKPINDF